MFEEPEDPSQKWNFTAPKQKEYRFRIKDKCRWCGKKTMVNHYGRCEDCNTHYYDSKVRGTRRG